MGGAVHSMSLEEKHVVEMDDVEFSKLAVSHLQRLKVPEVDQALLVSMLHRRGYSGLRFSCLLTERRSELNFCKLLKTCNVPMGKAKEVFKCLKIRVQMERQYRLPGTYGKSATTKGALSGNTFLSADCAIAAADPFVPTNAFSVDALRELHNFEMATQRPLTRS